MPMLLFSRIAVSHYFSSWVVHHLQDRNNDAAR